MEIVTMKDIYEQNEKILELLGEKKHHESSFNYGDFVNVKTFIDDAKLKVDNKYTLKVIDYKKTLVLVNFEGLEYKLRPPRWLTGLRPFQEITIEVKVVRKEIRKHLQLVNVINIVTPFG